MTAGEYYDYTIYLQPTVHTFAPGHKAVLVITAWDPYIEDHGDGDADETDKPREYSFDIDNASLEFRIPRSAKPPV
jgi:X-Pro dipeptidyl-peptidase